MRLSGRHFGWWQWLFSNDWQRFCPVSASSLLSLMFLLLLSSSIPSSVTATRYEFELDASLHEVECNQCVQLWRGASRDASPACTAKTTTCRGHACFMRQCKMCPVYQFMAGCVRLTEWQLAELAAARRHGELRARRFGAEILCEDTVNQTTCLCNRRDHCNNLYTRRPFTTYGSNLFQGIIDFDALIADIDPRYMDVITGFRRSFFPDAASSQLLSPLLFLLLLKLP